MKDPARLLDHGATSEELKLLRAGLTEEPGLEGKQRLAAALGLGVTAWGATSTASAATNAMSKAGMGASFGGKLGVKWLVVLAGGVTVGAAALVVMLAKPAPVVESTPPRAAPGVVVAAPRVAVTSADSAPSVGTDPAPVERVAVAEAPKAAAAPRQTVEASTPAPADSASISREIAAVDQVRTLVSKGQSSAALTALGKYRKEFPRGVLRQEATLLQIEALAKAGNLAAAREIGQRFLREHPRTPHEKRVRALLGDAP
jgi:hypothetical protein